MRYSVNATMGLLASRRFKEAYAGGIITTGWWAL